MQFNQAQFAAVIASAKAKAANSLRWLRAIDRAAAALQSGKLVVTLLHNGALVTSPRGSYFVKRILDACDNLFRWGSATRGHLREEQRERLNAMSLDDVISALM